MKYRERMLYIFMVVGSISWLVSLVMMFSFGNKYEWIGIPFFMIAIPGFIATLIFSIFIMAVGPREARFAVFKWILVFFPSIVTLTHRIPAWVPIIYSVAPVVLPASWLPNVIRLRAMFPYNKFPQFKEGGNGR